jgi:hypothetical protein
MDTPENPAIAGAGWPFIGRVVAKAMLLFLALNVLCLAMPSLDGLGRLSLYNRLFPGRLRLPYGEQSERAYNLTLDNVPAMLASHVISRPKGSDEYRVALLGDSGVWGWLLANEDTLAAALSQQGLTTAEGRAIVVYNLGYPVMSLTKDLLILDEALRYEPDMVVWLVTLESFPRLRQLEHPLLQRNPARIRELIRRFRLALDPADPRLDELSWPERTVIGRRRALADLLRQQILGAPWALTSVDQVYPESITLRRSDFEEAIGWQGLNEPQPLDDSLLVGDVLAAGVALAGDAPVLIVNEPIFIASGENSDRHYNAFYPRWAYDEYRRYLAQRAAGEGWRYLDLWDAIEPEQFTDTPVHLTPAGARQLAAALAGPIQRTARE